MRRTLLLLAWSVACRRSVDSSNEGRQGELATKNEIGRSGAYYVPAHSERGRWLHG
ncbi:MAG: hypothetical protein ACXWUG_04325 [Polyangiales bacterium]